MIIGSHAVYFRYDPSEDVIEVIQGGVRTWGNLLIVRHQTRVAPEDLTWESPGFTDSIIKKSTTMSGAEVKNASSDSDESDIESVDSVEGITQHLSNMRANSAPVAAPRRRVRTRGRINYSSQPVQLPRTINSPIQNDSELEAPMMTGPATTQQVSDTELWGLLNKLGWVDKDEIVRTPRYIANRIPLKQHRRNLYGGMLRLTEPLSNAFLNVGAYEALNVEARNNFLFHVIGKGQDFYTFSMASPEIASYLFEGKVQNLYSFLKQLI